jgi:hypothetical protein
LTPATPRGIVWDMRILARILPLALFVALPACVCGQSLSPAPPAARHHWYRDRVNWAILAVAVGSSLYATHEIHACRQRNDLIHCPDGGYGEFRAREELRGGVSLGTAILSIYGREHWRGGWRNELLNDAPVAAWSGWNVAVGRSNQTTPTFPRYDAAWRTFRVR